METWNYRIVKDKENYLTIRTVYYEDGKPYACSEQPAYIGSENVEELKQDFYNYMMALDKPVLNEDIFE